VKKIIFGVVACALLVVGTSTAQKNLSGQLGDNRVRATSVSIDPEGTGSVIYDPGTPADTFLTGSNGSYPFANYFGNLFDTQNGNPLSPGTITAVSWYQGAAPGTFVFVDFANATGSITTQLSATGIAANAFNAITASVSAPGPKFVGVAMYQASFGSVGARSASTNGQGFHGVQRGFYPYTNTLTGQNVMVRVAGTIVVPVELMEFDVE